jgi:hypothetical protein
MPGLEIISRDGTVQGLEVRLPDGTLLSDRVEVLDVQIYAKPNPTGQIVAVLTVAGVNINIHPGQVSWQLPGTQN